MCLSAWFMFSGNGDDGNECGSFVSLRFRWPKATVSVPVCVPLFAWFSGHIGVLGDTEGHKNPSVFIDVYEFVQEN